MHAMNVGKKLRFVQEKAKDTVADIIRRRQEAQAKMYAPNENTATVEELQNALMMCWPEIIEHRPRFFVLEKPAQEASQESFVTKNAASRYSTKGNGGVDPEEAEDFEGESERTKITKLSADEVTKGLRDATQPLDISTTSLRKRHAVLTQEVWLLRAEVGALQKHLDVLESAPASEEIQPVRKDSCPPPALPVQGRGGADQSSKEKHIADQSFSSRDVRDQISELARRMRELHREGDAVEMTAATARLMRMHTAWDHANNPSKYTSDGKKIDCTIQGVAIGDDEMESRVVNSLMHGDGTENMKQSAVKHVVELRRMAQNLRDDGRIVEGNVLEAIGLKLGRGVLSDEDLHKHTEEKKHGVARTRIHIHRDVNAPHPTGREGELKNLEMRIHDLADHLHDLHQKSDAKVVDLMLNRLLAMRQVRKKNHLSALGTQGSSNSMDSTDSRSFVASLSTLDFDSGWKEMGPLAARAVTEAAEVTDRLKEHGLEEEAETLNTLVDELARGLLSDYGITDPARSGK
jgi:hypothetical protein